MTTDFDTYLKQNSHCFSTTPRPLTSPHLEHDAADTPDVNLGVVPLLVRVDDFRSHPEDSTLHRSVRARHVDVVCSFRDTKVRDLADTSGLHQDVVCFHVLSDRSDFG